MIAGGGVRAVLELAGIHDILSKSLGSQNPINLVKATIAGLQDLRRPEEIAKLRGLSVDAVLGLGGGPSVVNGEATNGAAADEAAPAEEAVPTEEAAPAEEAASAEEAAAPAGDETPAAEAAPDEGASSSDEASAGDEASGRGRTPA